MGAAAGLLLVAPLGAGAATAPTTATLAFPATSPVLAEVHGRWTTTVLVQDTGLCAPAVTYRLVLTTPGDTEREPGTASVSPRPGPGCALQADTVSTVTVRFPGVGPVVPSSAVLVVEPGTGATAVAGPSTIVLLVRRSIGLGAEILRPIVVGVAAALLFALVVLWLAAADPSEAATDAGAPRANAKVPMASATWSFKDSWATNITAAGAVLGAVVTATGSVTSAFPGVPLYRFALLNVVYAGMAAVAPVIVGLGNTRPGGSQPTQICLGQKSLLAGSGVTLLALAGELTSFATLVWWSSAVTWARWVLIVVIALAGLVVLGYAVLATVSLYQVPASDVTLPPAHAALAQRRVERAQRRAKVAAVAPAGVVARVRQKAAAFAFSAPHERAAAV